MADLSRMINPTASIQTQSDALAAGRAGALGAFLMAAASVIGSLEIFLTADAYLAKMRAATIAQYGEGTEVAQAALSMMTPTMIHMTVTMTLVFAVLYVVLGAVQWRKPNVIIPLLLGLLSAYGLATMLLAQLNGSAVAAQMHVPIWRQALSAVVAIAALLLFYNGFRGANRLSKLRREAA